MIAATLAGNQPAQHKSLHAGDSSPQSRQDQHDDNNNANFKPERQTGANQESRQVSVGALQEENSCPSSNGSNSSGAWPRRNSNSNSSLSAKRFEGAQKLNLILPTSQQTSSLTTPNDIAAANGDNEAGNRATGRQQQQVSQLPSANRQLFIDSLAQQLASSANGQGPDVSLFTGLPSCTPASADRLAATTSVNPFFWGLASSASTATEPPNGSVAESCVSAANGGKQQAGGYDGQQQQKDRQHKTPVANVQAANTLSPMILSPLSIFGLSPQQEAWLCLGLSPNQHPLTAATNRQYPNPFLQQSQQQSDQRTNFSQQRAQDLTSHQQLLAGKQTEHLAHQNGDQQVVNPAISFTHPIDNACYQQQANQYGHQFQQQQQCYQPSQRQQISQMQAASSASTISQPVIHFGCASNQPVQPDHSAANYNANLARPVRQYATNDQQQTLLLADAQRGQQFVYAARQQQQPQVVLTTCIQQAQAPQLVAAHQNNYPINHSNNNLQHNQNFQQQAFLLVNQQQVAAQQGHSNGQSQAPLDVQIPYQQPSQQLSISPSPHSSRLIATDSSLNPPTQRIAKLQDQSHHLSPNHQHQQQIATQNVVQTKELAAATSALTIVSPTPSCSSSNGRLVTNLRHPSMESEVHPPTGLTSQQASANASPVHQQSSLSRSSSGGGDDAMATANSLSNKRPPNECSPLSSPAKSSVLSTDPTKSKGSQDGEKTLYLINGSKHLKASKKQSEVKAQQQTTITNESGETVVVKKKSRGGRKKKLVTHEELIARKNRSKERNRVAAKRCRQKRKQFLDELRDKIDGLNELNQKLQKENAILKSELQTLKQHHSTCRL